jgi:adenine deaminase
MKIGSNKIRKELVEAALGSRSLDLVIKDVKLVNVFTGEIYDAEIGIYDRFIAHISADPDQPNRRPKPLDANNTFDGKGMYVIPGFIDPHIHIESTMMTPTNFAACVLPSGTTTVVTDPHEVANIMGIQAVKYMHAASENLPMRQYILAPSCVPASPGLENSGATLGAEEIAQILELDRVIGLGEIMDFAGVISNDKRIRSIIREAEKRNAFLQGHSPRLTGRKLSAYLCGGPVSDHEVSFGTEAREKLRLGMYIDARESSMSRNVAEIVDAVKSFPLTLSNLTLCTDDREPEDLLEEGHMNHVVRRAVAAGLDPVVAIRCATLNAAREIGIENLGAIAPGYVADLVIVPSLKELEPYAVFFEGKQVAQEGQLTVEIPQQTFPIESTNTIHLDTPDESMFKIAAPIQNGRVSTRVISYQSLDSNLTEFAIEELPVKEGYLDISHDTDLKYAAVLNRHKGFSNYSLGVVRNFGTQKGTAASTIAHDCHNLTVVYSTPAQAVLAIKELIECGGGIVCILDDQVLAKLELPIFGILSPLSCQALSKNIPAIKYAYNTLGLSKSPNPLLRTAVLSLSVIPMARITDKGLVSVMDASFVSLFV